jgi:DNA-binding cell septation regulator SpoVG
MATELTIELRLLENQKSGKAVGSVTIATDLGEVTILGVKVIHQDGKEPWVALPQVEWETKDTKEKRRKDIVNLSHRLDKTIKDAILAKYAEISQNGSPF